MATIKDVAKEAGVSIATVSYVLNNSPRISSSTKRKVNDAIEKLNYVPNLAAQGLKNQLLPLIIIVLNSFSGPIYQEIVDIMVKRFNDNGLSVLISTGEDSFNFIKTHPVSGAIILDTSVKMSEKQSIANCGTIIASRRHFYLGDKSYPINYIDGFKPFKEITKLAINEGYKDLMYVHGAFDSIDEKERCLGFLSALKEKSISPLAMLDGNFTEKSGYDAIKNYIQNGGKLPEVIFSANDEMAIGIIHYLNEKEELVPNKVKVIGYDNIELSKYLGLTTINNNRNEWASYITEQIIKVINDKKEVENLDVFESKFEIIRRNTF